MENVRVTRESEKEYLLDGTGNHVIKGTFVVPIYCNRGEFYFHKLDQNCQEITKFEKASIESRGNFIELEKSEKRVVKIGDPAIFAYFKRSGDLIIGTFEEMQENLRGIYRAHRVQGRMHGANELERLFSLCK